MASHTRSQSHSNFEPAEPRAENEQAYVVRLTPAVHSRLVQFFNRSENHGLRQSDVIESLLTATEPGTPEPQRPTYSPPVTRRRGLVTSLPSPPPRRVTTQYIHDQGDEDEDEDDYESEESGEVVEEDDDEEDVEDVDEELNYPGDYIYEEEVIDHGPASPVSPPRNMSNVHDYYYTPETKFDTRRRLVTGERRSTRLSSPRAASASQQKKQCHPERKGVGTGKQKPWTSNLRRYLYDIIVKWQRDDLLHCRECDRWMRVVHKSCGLRCGNALDHVCRHLGKPMYACRLCPHQTVAQIQMRKHLKNAHRRTNDFDDLTDSFYSELAERISRCFDYTNIGEPPAVGSRKLLTCKKKPGEAAVGKKFLEQEMDLDMSPVRRFIYELIMKWQKDNAMYCRYCDHWVRVGTESSWAQSQAALAHVCGHYGKSLYLCLICDERTVTSCQMIRHIRHVHQTISRGNCREEIDDPIELKNMAARCFDWEEGTEPPPMTQDSPFLKKRRRISSARKPRALVKQPGSCRLEALEYARSLIREFSNDAKTMKCQECEAPCSVKTGKGLRPEGLFDHAVKHVDKDIFECPKCKKTGKKKDTMRLHMIIHKDAQPTDYIDKTGDFREEIFETMKQCFDLDYKKVEAGNA